MSRTVLTLMAHPDDAEILAGGVLCCLADHGWKVHIATATNGDCGSSTLPPDEIAAIRRQEAQNAARLLGGQSHSLGRKDLEVVYEPTLLRDACGLLRQTRPDLVITHSPTDYMLDHEQISRVARAACFNAPIPNAPSSQDLPPLERIPHLYYADPVEGVGLFGELVVPSILVDIAAVLDRKKKLVAAHASQREWLRHHHGMDEYIDQIERWATARGELGDLECAEGYRQHSGHAYPHSDLLSETLGELVKKIAALRPPT